MKKKNETCVHAIFFLFFTFTERTKVINISFKAFQLAIFFIFTG